jgi:hypothetical protein
MEGSIRNADDEGKEEKKQMTAIEPFLNRLIDYAGLFPPAGLDMLTSTRNYACYRSGKYAWALGRLIVPVARLTEFSAALMEVGTTSS